MEKTKIGLVPCPECKSKDVRFRTKINPHRLCRRCGNSWDELEDKNLD